MIAPGAACGPAVPAHDFHSRPWPPRRRWHRQTTALPRAGRVRRYARLPWLGPRMAACRLVGQLARVEHQKTYSATSRRRPGLHWHTADDTCPCQRRGGSWRVRPGFPATRATPVLLAPRLHLLTHRTGARDERDQSHALLQTQPQRGFTVSLTVRYNAAYSVESQRQTLFNGHWGISVLSLVLPLAHPTRVEPITTHAETEQHLFKTIRPSLLCP